jgi:hypothetical protein
VTAITLFADAARRLHTYDFIPNPDAAVPSRGCAPTLVVLAALGAFAVRINMTINMTQQHSNTLDLQELRAQAALQAGLEYAAARLAGGGNCNRVRNIPGMPGNFTVTFVNCVGRHAPSASLPERAYAACCLSTSTSRLPTNCQFATFSITALTKAARSCW